MSSTRNTAVEKSMLVEINRLRQMNVAQLRDEWFRLYGEPSASRNRDYLWRRLAWRIQELALGGLSERARARIEELAPTTFIRAQLPRGYDPAAMPPLPDQTADNRGRRPRPVRDQRLPTPGTVITRRWHGRDLRLLVREDGYELGGVRYESLSEAARAATGSRWSGWLFWGLTQRTRKK